MQPLQRRRTRPPQRARRRPQRRTRPRRAPPRPSAARGRRRPRAREAGAPPRTRKRGPAPTPGCAERAALRRRQAHQRPAEARSCRHQLGPRRQAPHPHRRGRAQPGRQSAPARHHAPEDRRRHVHHRKPSGLTLSYLMNATRGKPSPRTAGPRASSRRERQRLLGGLSAEPRELVGQQAQLARGSWPVTARHPRRRMSARRA